MKMIHVTVTSPRPAPDLSTCASVEQRALQCRVDEIITVTAQMVAVEE
jgi:hypothetical protein